MGKLVPTTTKEWLAPSVMHDPIAKKDPILGSLFGKKPSAPPVAPPAPMPAMNDEEMRKARQRQIAAAQARGGRASTILTDEKSDKLG
jgi:hypothetical protein